MAEPHAVLNALSAEDASAALLRCCGSKRWVHYVLLGRPFASAQALYREAREAFQRLGTEDYLEAFSHHPSIGADAKELSAKGEATAAMSGQEQSRIRSADPSTLVLFREGNLAYLEKFGFVFLVCATGKSAEEMLELLQRRIENEPPAELHIAAGELAQITRLRLEKLAL